MSDEKTTFRSSLVSAHVSVQDSNKISFIPEKKDLNSSFCEDGTSAEETEGVLV